MASLKLDLVNIVDEIHQEFAAGYRDIALGCRLHQLTAGLNVTFDIMVFEHTHEGLVMEFTGRPADLAILIRRYESDPEMRAELHDRITYVKPMDGSCQS